MIEGAALSIQQSAFSQSRFTAKDAKEQLAISIWQLAFVFCSYALGVRERLHRKGRKERKGNKIAIGNWLLSLKPEIYRKGRRERRDKGQSLFP